MVNSSLVGPARHVKNFSALNKEGTKNSFTFDVSTFTKDFPVILKSCSNLQTIRVGEFKGLYFVQSD